MHLWLTVCKIQNRSTDFLLRAVSPWSLESHVHENQPTKKKKKGGNSAVDELQSN